MITRATETEDVARRAAESAAPFAAIPPADRAAALRAVADALAAERTALVELAMDETGLSEARLAGELARTVVQIKLFSDVVREGKYWDARIDERDDGFVLGTRPDIRRMHIPLGPVLNFAASNFPFAFSVAGGDSIAALAAGCPVIVKAHSGHPGLSDLTARIVIQALDAAGMPRGVFQLVHGQEAGVALLRDARVKAGSFTGSEAVGQMLSRVAAERATPIPFFGELGSVNPVFVTSAAFAERSDEIVAGLAASVSGSAGQLCTKPGFIFVPTLDGIAERLLGSFGALDEHRLLNPRTTEAYRARRAAILKTPGVTALVTGGIRVEIDGQGWVTPTIAATTLSHLRDQFESLREEVFGPMALIIEYPAETDLAAVLASLYPGSLTVSIHLGEFEQRSGGSSATGRLVDAAMRHAGRVVFDGWPTGVAVTPAMQHGGPWPATTNDSSTSVGTAAIGRFLRPVALQSSPAAYLPPPLRDDNPWNVPQSRSLRGESGAWGSR